MNYPPLMMRLRIRGHKMPRINLWLPLFLLYPLLLAVLVVLSPLILAGLLVAFIIFSVRLDLFAFVRGLYELLCSLRGFTVQVQEADRFEVDIQFR
jgi:hypothetical protein